MLTEVETAGRINADLSVGTDVTAVVPLRSNEGLSVRGVEFHGDGFVVSMDRARELLPDQAIFDRLARPYLHSSQLKGSEKQDAVFDLYSLDEKALRTIAPTLYDHLLKTAYVSRRGNHDRYRRENWWKLARPHVELRDGLNGISSYITTIITGKHRWFTKANARFLPDQGLLSILTDDLWVLGVLSSTIHIVWAAERGTLEARPRYNNTVIFDPFPFPIKHLPSSKTIAELADELDATRRIVLVECPTLRMTELYNLIEDVRSGKPLSSAREATVVRARARLLTKLHDDLDQAVADAYGWGEEWRRAPLPPAEIVRRLVSLNAERAAEEKAGTVRWLRPDYQRPRFGKAAADAPAAE